METIFVLLPLAVLIAGISLALFVWAARSGQFDDLDTPAVRMLFDDEEPRRPADATARAASAATPEKAIDQEIPVETTNADSTRRAPE